MIERNVIIQKFTRFDHCLERIESKIAGEPKRLKDLDVQDIFILNLQRAAQLLIDVAAHIIKDEGYEMPKTLREYFLVLASNNIICSELAEDLAKMAGFRNIAVHDYQKLDVAILESIYQEKLDGMREFKRIIIELL